LISPFCPAFNSDQNKYKHDYITVFSTYTELTLFL